MTLLHPDWKQLKQLDTALYGTPDGVLGWHNIALDLVVMRNPFTGKYHYSRCGDEPDIRATCNSKQWAMMLAQSLTEGRG